MTRCWGGTVNGGEWTGAQKLGWPENYIQKLEIKVVQEGLTIQLYIRSSWFGNDCEGKKKKKKTAETCHNVAVGWSNPLPRCKGQCVSGSERVAQAELCKDLVPCLSALCGDHKERWLLTAVGTEKGKKQGWQKQDLLYKRRPKNWHCLA